MTSNALEGRSDKIKKQVEKNTFALARKIKKNQGKVKPSLKTKVFFNIMRLMQKRGWNEADINYWNEKGWTGNKRPWKKEAGICNNRII